MWESVLAETVAKVAVGFLHEYLARADLKNATSLAIAVEMEELARKASEWKARALADPESAARLRVRPDAGTVALPGDAAPAEGESPPRGV
mgnify:FL=1